VVVVVVYPGFGGLLLPRYLVILGPGMETCTAVGFFLALFGLLEADLKIAFVTIKHQTCFAYEMVYCCGELFFSC
jgi:hypothetical protein